jgi:hypothetical protein
MGKYIQFGLRMLGTLLLITANLGAQDSAPPATDNIAPQAAARDSSAAGELELLVGRVALYPDDLLSIILPGSTFPLQIVEANRWLQKNRDNKDAKPKESWDDSVKALLNYPEVIGMMSEDLDWTASMGEAVVADQTAVMDAVQSFRRKAEGAGNLRSDDKQEVVVEEQVVKIVQSDPQVIYVPQYEPTVVVVQQQVPVYPAYYPNPYPVYYYPYPPGHAVASAFFWGAATAYAFNWFHGSIHGDIDIDIDIDRDVNRDSDRDRSIDSRSTNIDRSESQQMAKENRGSWQSQQSAADVRQGRTSPATAQTGNAGQRPRNNAARSAPATRGGTPAAGASQANRGNLGVSKSNLNYQNTNRSSGAARSSQPTNSAYSGISNGRSVNAQSARGSFSRGASRGGGRRR